MGHNSIKKYSIYWGNWSTLSTTADLYLLLLKTTLAFLEPT